jgi:hypothetical protein
MPRPKPDPELVAYVVALLKMGWTCDDISADLAKRGYSVSRSSVHAWGKAHQSAPGVWR